MFVKKCIEFTVIHQSKKHRVKTSWGEYKTLRLLLSEKLNISGLGECGGMGKCITCLIEITDISGSTGFLKRSEHTSLQRMIKGFSIVRFSCQVPINYDLDNVTIRILKTGKAI